MDHVSKDVNGLWDLFNRVHLQVEGAVDPS